MGMGKMKKGSGARREVVVSRGSGGIMIPRRLIVEINERIES